MSKFTRFGWYQALIDYMQNAGFDITLLNQKVGIQILEPELMQITQDDMTRLWNVALDISNDPLLGLKVGQSVKPGSIGVVSYAMMSSQNVGDSIRLLLNHQHLLADALDFVMVEHEHDLEVVLNNIGDELPASPLSIDASVMTFLNFFRWLTRNSIQFNAVELTRKEMMLQKEYEVLLNCPVRFDRSQNSVRIKHSQLAIPLVTADSQMLELHQQALAELAKQRMHGGFSKMVTKLIRQYLGQELCNSNYIAQRLYMSKSKLQRNLAAEQTNFQQLLDETRVRLGVSLLRHSDLSLSQVAERLGYASSNGFCRGFKRLTGNSPGEHRKLND